MDSPQLAKDERDLLQNLIAGQSGRKSNSLNDLLQGQPGIKSGTKRTGGSGAAGPYANVESKVKTYIASLPAPNSRRKPFKKHTSMPGYIGDCVTANSEASMATCLQLEQEFNDYRRQSEHTISELEKQVQVAVTMISQANNENFDLMDRIEHLEKEAKGYNNRPTPLPHPVQVAQLVLTPKKVMPPAMAQRILANDTTGSFIGQSAADTGTATTTTTLNTSGNECHSRGVTPTGTKRNLSFNSSSELTRRSGTDSGINTSDGNEIQIREAETLLGRRIGGGGVIEELDDEEDDDDDDSSRPPLEKRSRRRSSSSRRRQKKKGLKRYIAKLLCCGAGAAAEPEAGPKISYKKI